MRISVVPSEWDWAHINVKESGRQAVLDELGLMWREWGAIRVERTWTWLVDRHGENESKTSRGIQVDPVDSSRKLKCAKPTTTTTGAHCMPNSNLLKASSPQILSASDQQPLPASEACQQTCYPEYLHPIHDVALHTCQN